MKTIVFRMVPALLLVAATWTAPPVHGHDGCRTFSGLPNLYGFGTSGNLYGLGRIPIPPYFALHPPVYYSHPVARAYGLSPFAHRRAPLMATSTAPHIIENPFVRPPEGGPRQPVPKPLAPPTPPSKRAPMPQSKPKKQERAADGRPQPRIVVNPFVASATELAGR